MLTETDKKILVFLGNVKNYCKVTNCDVCKFKTSRGCQWRNLFDYALGGNPKYWNLDFAGEIMNEEKKESENE